MKLTDDWKITNMTSFEYQNKYAKEWMNVSRGITIIGIECTVKQFACDVCKNRASVKQTRARNFNHVRGYGFDTILKVRIPQVFCRSCGTVKTFSFPLAREFVSYTLEFENHVIRLMTKGTVTDVSEEMCVGTWIVWDIVVYWVTKALENLDLSHVTMITIDETSFKKGNNFVTVVCDQNRKLIFMCEGKDKETVKRFCDWLIEHKGDAKNIKIVCSDMSPAYEAGVKDYLVNAIQIFDKFHIFKLLNEDMDRIRKRLLRSASQDDRKRMGNIRFTVFKHQSNMNEADIERLETIRLVNPELALAYDMKETFFLLYEQDCKEDAIIFFNTWWEWVSNEGPMELKKRAMLLSENLDKILSWYDYPMTNAFAEGVNSKIQKIKADGCGYTNVDNFIMVCFLKLGDLDIDVQ